MVRIIGRGAYGEIWLARSHRHWRAVKIVDRSILREKPFSAIRRMAKFERSRSHDGFIDTARRPR